MNFQAPNPAFQAPHHLAVPIIPFFPNPVWFPVYNMPPPYAINPSNNPAVQPPPELLPRQEYARREHMEWNRYNMDPYYNRAQVQGDQAGVDQQFQQAFPDDNLQQGDADEGLQNADGAGEHPQVEGANEFLQLVGVGQYRPEAVGNNDDGWAEHSEDEHWQEVDPGEGWIEADGSREEPDHESEDDEDEELAEAEADDDDLAQAQVDAEEDSLDANEIQNDRPNNNPKRRRYSNSIPPAVIALWRMLREDA